MQNTHTVKPVTYEPTPTHNIQKVSLTAPLCWLKAGLQDFRKAPLISLVYGLIFALIGVGISAASINQPQFTLTFWTGFLLIGPVMAVGLYRIAQLLDRGEDVNLGSMLATLRTHKMQVGIFVAMMLFIMIAWIRFSSLMVALFFGQMSPGIEAFTEALGSPEGLSFLGVLFASGGVFAFIVFAASALTLPMIIDDKAELIPAMATSFKAVFARPGPMLVWAALIASLTFLGMVTLFIGLVFIFPLLGYATWHSYKDLV